MRALRSSPAAKEIVATNEPASFRVVEDFPKVTSCAATFFVISRRSSSERRRFGEEFPRRLGFEPACISKLSYGAKKIHREGRRMGRALLGVITLMVSPCHMLPSEIGQNRLIAT